MHPVDVTEAKICVVGLGYVGLPLALEFSKLYPVIGFDISQQRVQQLMDGYDRTNEVSSQALNNAKTILYSSDVASMSSCNVFIVTVPTPIDSHKRPDLSFLLSASKLVGQVLKKGDTVIFESTVYPGATEEECVPVLAATSGLQYNSEFFVGYSPERINPGDRERSLVDIVKVTSGSTPSAAHFIDSLYGTVVTAGTYKAESIQVAEAAKVIENTQRDLNIALINELSLIFKKMNLSTEKVLEAAGTKWNFLPFRPGLVGGHCIGVDPYYLAFKAQQLGFHPEIINAGRRLNDSMGEHVVSDFVRSMISKGISIAGSRVLVLGLSFKENCPDIRNSKVVDVIQGLLGFGLSVDCFDPLVDPKDAEREYGINLLGHPGPSSYDGILIAVAHDEFKVLGLDGIKVYAKTRYVLADLKYMFSEADVDLRL